MGRILIIPGTKWQIPLIQKIKSLGHDIQVPLKKRSPQNMILFTTVFSLDAENKRCIMITYKLEAYILQNDKNNNSMKQ